MATKRLFLYVFKVTIGLLLTVPWLLVFVPYDWDEDWRIGICMGIQMVLAPIWLPFMYEHRRDNRPTLGIRLPGQQKNPFRPPPRGPGFIWVVAGSSVMSALGLYMLFSHPIGDYLRRAHANRAMAAIGADVSDEQYFEALVDFYQKVSPDVERTFGIRWLSTNHLWLEVERASDGLFTLHLHGDGDDTVKCRTTGRLSGDGLPNPHNNLGACANEEGALLMTLVLELASSRADRVDKILYTARTSWREVDRVFEASVRPGVTTRRTSRSTLVLGTSLRPARPFCATPSRV